mmetsp:Transcript_18848/g.51896  ORF Transcript_18848/g.51896 Transcript_18848/m.51896 type:complete len:86 (+) Transcript_18848:3-260(+)
MQSGADHDSEDDDYDHHMLRPTVVGSLQCGEGKALKDYKLGQKLGEGAFGVVRLCWSRNNPKAYAIIAIFGTAIMSLFLGSQSKF